jgi:hypothetical protein
MSAFDPKRTSGVLLNECHLDRYDASIDLWGKG